MQKVLRTALAAGSTAAEVANYGGAPFLGPAALLLGELGRTCDQVQVHKSLCKQLIKHVQIILDALQGDSSELYGSRLQAAADALENTLRGIIRKLSQFTSWSFVRAYWKRDEVARALRRAKADLDSYKERFHIQAQLATMEKLTESQQMNQRDNEEIRMMLQQILMKQDHMSSIIQMRQQGEPAAEEIMRDAQTELHEHSRESPTYAEFQSYILNFHRSTGVMPTIPNLSHEIVRLEGPPLAGGTYSEVSKGLWLGQVEVALKSLREVKASESKPRKRFEHEITIWHSVEHRNLLRFLGIVDNIGPHLCIVSPWQVNGNILEYTKRNPDVDRIQLLLGAARGIEYLHGRDKPVIHGNLKCSNILVSDEGEALITDFGLARVMEDITEVSTYSTFTSSGGIRWLAPELMGESGSQTLETDVYAFSMSILEGLTSEKPFSEHKRDPHVVVLVTTKKRPKRPQGAVWDRWFTNSLWDLLEQCWHHDPQVRPRMSIVVNVLESHITSNISPSLT